MQRTNYLYYMTTKQALDQLLNDEAYLLAWLKAGRTKDERRLLRHRLANGKLTIDKQEELLTAFGFGVKQEKLWTKPTS